MLRNNDTIAAIATPPGEGGVAVIRISGPRAFEVGDIVFRPYNSDSVRELGGYAVRYGRIVAPGTDEPIDDGLVSTFRAPRSYTGEDVIEISCHGGRANTLRVQEAVFATGARPAEPGEFTLRAFLNGRIDLAQAEAVADVVRARTETARIAAQRQLRGALSETISALRSELIGALAAIEVTIDFSDEVGDLEYDALAQRLTSVADALDRLLADAARGRMLREGIRVAIAGRPNVGKSSLLNRLLRSQRAIVTPIPGTTRDVIEESANVNGVPVVYVDTAGIRETADPVEKIGVERALSAIDDADVLLLVLDATDQGDDPPSLTERRTVVALNKIDLVPGDDVSAAIERVRTILGEAANVLPVSALYDTGIAELELALLPAGSGAMVDETLITSARHQEALVEARALLGEALSTTEQRLPGDFIAIDVRGSLDALGRITGETVTDEVIHRIFHEFCVGK